MASSRLVVSLLVALVSTVLAQQQSQQIDIERGIPFPPNPLTGATTQVQGATYGNGQYTVRGSSEVSPAFSAFDGNLNSGWKTNQLGQSNSPSTPDIFGTNVGGEYLEITFPQPVWALSYKLFDNSDQFPTEFGLAGSNDGNTWNVIDYRSGALTKGQTLQILVGWTCVQDVTTPVRLHPTTGNVECMSQNGRDCLWQPNMVECSNLVYKQPADLRPLQCGEMHKQIYGGDGYSPPDHWCAKARASFHHQLVYYRATGINFPGNDMAYHENTNRPTCEKRCRETTGCKLFAMDAATETRCWLKSDMKNYGADPSIVLFMPYKLDYYSRYRFIYAKSQGNPPSLQELAILGVTREGFPQSLGQPGFPGGIGGVPDPKMSPMGASASASASASARAGSGYSNLFNGAQAGASASAKSAAGAGSGSAGTSANAAASAFGGGGGVGGPGSASASASAQSSGGGNIDPNAAAGAKAAASAGISSGSGGSGASANANAAASAGGPGGTGGSGSSASANAGASAGGSGGTGGPGSSASANAGASAGGSGSPGVAGTSASASAQASASSGGSGGDGYFTLIDPSGKPRRCRCD